MDQFLRHINISYDFDLKLKMKLYNFNKFENNSSQIKDYILRPIDILPLDVYIELEEAFEVLFLNITKNFKELNL